MTRLGDFLINSKIRPAELARVAGISRQHLLRLRKGIAQPSLRVMVAIVRAAGAILGRAVSLSDMFDVL